MTKTGSNALNGVDDTEKPDDADMTPPIAPGGPPTILDETEINAAGDRVPREPEGA